MRSSPDPRGNGFGLVGVGKDSEEDDLEACLNVAGGSAVWISEGFGLQAAVPSMTSTVSPCSVRVVQLQSLDKPVYFDETFTPTRGVLSDDVEGSCHTRAQLQDSACRSACSFSLGGKALLLNITIGGSRQAFPS